MREAVEGLLATLEGEYLDETAGLKDIGGPTGMRNSMASALGLARNTVRAEIIERLREILKAR